MSTDTPTPIREQTPTASRITALARKAPFYVATLREMMEPSSATITAADLAPSGGKSSPRPPMAVEMLHLADQEATSIGLIARYAVSAYGVALPVAGVFWTPGGRIKGIRTDALTSGRFQALCQALIAHAEEIEGASHGDEHLQDLLNAGEGLRDYTSVLIPGGDAPKWLTEEQARGLSGRTSRTLAQWRWDGAVIYDRIEGGSKPGFLYREDSLRTATVIADNANRFSRRRLVAKGA